MRHCIMAAVAANKVGLVGSVLLLLSQNPSRKRGMLAELINFAYEVLPAEAIGPGRDRAESNVSFYIESGKRTAVDAALADGSSRRQP